jgi:hypothetical protein
MKSIIWRPGNRVLILRCPSNESLVCRTGTVIKRPAVGGPTILRVRLDGGTADEWVEVDRARR